MANIYIYIIICPDMHAGNLHIALPWQCYTFLACIYAHITLCHPILYCLILSHIILDHPVSFDVIVCYSVFDQTHYFLGSRHHNKWYFMCPPPFVPRYCHKWDVTSHSGARRHTSAVVRRAMTLSDSKKWPISNG